MDTLKLEPTGLSQQTLKLDLALQTPGSSPVGLSSLGLTLQKLSLDEERSARVCELERSRTQKLGATGALVLTGRRGIRLHPLTFEEMADIPSPPRTLKPEEVQQAASKPCQMSPMSPSVRAMIEKDSMAGSAHLVGLELGSVTSFLAQMM
eukprot:TRINITY_DN106346_c0_g1_i1.p1 TRINITY_DN106346_c0_g1~~TRINITY_DN106346_c0_g1_i1.p1  ORF type:complete len:151 (+),score=19.69 TRINITY_DN106346_c0_g1_i1:153-605(+)